MNTLTDLKGFELVCVSRGKRGRRGKEFLTDLKDLHG
jgi:hypothetical protein